MTASKRGCREAAAVAALSAFEILAGCSGSGSPANPRPAVSATPGALVATQVEAARGTMQLALRNISADRYYAEFLRPGTGPLFAATGTTVPACNPAGDSATQAFASQTGNQTLLTYVAYPAGDATCSKSPTRIAVLQITRAGGAATVNGYQVTFALASDPVVTPGSIAGFEQLQAGIYSTVDGSAGIDTRVDESAAIPAGGIAQPAPGTFPATFPSALPMPPEITAAFGASAYYATTESGHSSTTGTATGFSGFTTSSGATGNLGTLDTLSVSAIPGGTGTTTLTSRDASPEYALDFGAAQSIIVTPNPFPLPMALTQWSLEPLSSLGIVSNALNFPAAAVGKAGFTPSGDLTSCGVTYVDQPNAVSTAISCNADGTMDMVVTDLLRHAVATAPSPIVLDASGSSAPFTYLLDSTTDVVGNFHIQQPQD